MWPKAQKHPTLFIHFSLAPTPDSVQGSFWVMLRGLDVVLGMGYVQGQALPCALSTSPATLAHTQKSVS